MRRWNFWRPWNPTHGLLVDWAEFLGTGQFNKEKCVRPGTPNLLLFCLRFVSKNELRDPMESGRLASRLSVGEQ